VGTKWQFNHVPFNDLISTNSISAYSCHMTYIGCLMFSAVLTMENIYYMLLSSDTCTNSVSQRWA